MIWWLALVYGAALCLWAFALTNALRNHARYSCKEVIYVASQRDWRARCSDARCGWLMRGETLDDLFWQIAEHRMDKHDAAFTVDDWTDRPDIR